MCIYYRACIGTVVGQRNRIYLSRMGLVGTMAHIIRKTHWLTIASAIIAFCSCGCGQVTVPVPQEIRFSEQLEIDGQQWTKKVWGESETTRVDAYFKKAPYLADNSGFNGQQVCYANGSGKERCYWVSATDAATHWLMIEFDGSIASQLVEGTGAPFTRTGN